ncbi:MAG: MATE family efflux transporter [Eubacteriales bacterium]|nr:MATE family efflux transporter [Eubacteriales bacterium]
MEAYKEKQENNEEKDFVRESFLTLPLGRLMMKNALPAISSMLFMALYQAIDAMLVGRRFGPEALASVNILYPILSVFVGLAVMIGVGGNAKIAVLLGAGKNRQASQILGLIVVLGASLGIVGSIIVKIFFPQILTALGTSGTLGVFAGEYLAVMYPFFTPMVLFFILEQSLRNDGRASMAASVMGLMAILNIILDYIFLFVLDFGIGGAAMATGISQSIGASLFSWYFLNKLLKRKSGLVFARPRCGITILGTIIANGSSELFNSLAVGVTTFLFNLLILSYVGSLGVAAFSVTQYLLTVVMMIFMGLGNGIQPIISYNYGAGHIARVRGTLWRTMTASLIIGILSFVVMRTQTETLAAIFIPDHPEAIAATLRVASSVSWSMLFIPIGIILSVFFTALEKAKKSLIIAVCRGFIFTIAGLTVFPTIWGEFGIWITPVFAEGATALVGAVMLIQWLSEYKPVDPVFCGK